MKRLRRNLRAVFFSVLSLLVVIPVGARLALETEVGRELVRKQVLTGLKGVIEGTVVIDSISHLSFTAVRVRGLHVFDLKQREVASAKQVSARISLWPLLSRRVVVTRLWIEQAVVDLGAPLEEGEARGGLLGVFPETPDAASKEPITWTVALARIDISHSEVRVVMNRDAYAMRRLNARAAVTIKGDSRVSVSQLWTRVHRNDSEVAAMRGEGLLYTSNSEASGRVEIAHDKTRVWIRGTLGAPQGSSAQALDLQLSAHRLSPDVVRALGVDVGPWSSPVNAALRVHGDTQRLNYALDVAAGEGQVNARGQWNHPASLSITVRANNFAPRDVVDVDVAPITATLRAEIKAAADLSAAEGHFHLADATYDGERLPVVRVGGAWSEVSGLNLPSIHARRGNAELKAALRLTPAGVVELHARASRLRFKQTEVRHVALDIVGGPGRYRVLLDLRDQGRFDGRVMRRGQRLIANGRGVVRLEPVDGLKLDIRDLEYHLDRNTVRIGSVHAQHAGASARVRGVYDPDRASHLELMASVPDLVRLTRPWTDTEVPGKVAIHAVLDGATARPTITLSAQFQTPTLSVLRDVTVDAEVTAELGRRVAVSANLRSRLRFDGDETPVTLAIVGDYRDNHVDVKIDAADRQGPLIRTQIKTDLKRGSVPRGREDVATFLNERAWDASLWLAVRRVDDLPGVRSLGLDEELLPAYVSADAQLAHQPGHEPEGSLELRAVFRDEERPRSPACLQVSRPVINVSAKMEDGSLSAVATVEIDGTTVLTVKGKSGAPLTEWLVPVEPRPLSVSAQVTGLRLGELPVVCERADGVVSGSVGLTRGVSRKVVASVDLRGDNLRVAQGPLFGARVVAKMDDDALVARAQLRSGEGTALIRGRFPIDALGNAPTLDLDAPVQAHADLRQIDLPALLAAVPQIRARAGTVDGEIRLAGTLSAPDLRGELTLDEVSILLPELGQPFERVNGRMLLEGNRLRLLPTRIHDRDGWADVTGDFYFENETLHATLEIKADTLPIRRGGVILARFDGKATIKAKIAPDRTDLSLLVRKASVQLAPNSSITGVQPLAANTDIRFVDGSPGLLEEAPTAETASSLFVSIDAAEPFWVRREDFSLLVSTRLKVEHRGDETPVITGAVEIQRGVVELVGRLFDVERGRIAFTGGHELEPTLEVIAHHRVPGGSRVTVEARGTLNAPELRFLVDDAPVTAGEALAAAAGTSASDGGGAAVQQQVGAMATGLLAGVLTLGARQGFGEWIPVIAIESDDQQTRVRAGIEARHLIPKFLRSLVIDAYVEGSLSAQNDGDDSRQQVAPQTGAAVLLELRFPHHLVGEAEIGPGSRWSTDLSWEP